MDIIAGDTWEVKVYCSQWDQVGINILHWRFITAGSPNVTDQDLANQSTLQFSGVYSNFMNPIATYWGTTCKRVLPTPETAMVANTIGITTGADGGSPLPAQASGLIGWYTALGGRKYRGRTYPPFPTNSWIDVNGNMNAAGQAVLDAMRAQIVTWTGFTGVGGGTAAIQLVLFHRATVMPPAAAFTTDITRGTARMKFATQRRRGQTGRPNAIPPF